MYSPTKRNKMLYMFCNYAKTIYFTWHSFILELDDHIWQVFGLRTLVPIITFSGPIGGPNHTYSTYHTVFLTFLPPTCLPKLVCDHISSKMPAYTRHDVIKMELFIIIRNSDNYHLFSAYHVPCIVQSTLYVLLFTPMKKLLLSWFHMETEEQKG